MSDRDTKFLGFATLLFQELNALYQRKGLDLLLGDPGGEVAQQETTLIAQRAYDLAVHVTPEVVNKPNYTPERLVQDYATDLTEWPARNEP